MKGLWKGNFKVRDPDAGITSCDLGCEHRNVTAGGTMFLRRKQSPDTRHGTERGECCLCTHRNFSGATQGQFWVWSSESSALCSDGGEVNASTYLWNCLAVTPKSFSFAFQSCLRKPETYYGRRTGAIGRKLMCELCSPATGAAPPGRRWPGCCRVWCSHHIHVWKSQSKWNRRHWQDFGDGGSDREEGHWEQHHSAVGRLCRLVQGCLQQTRCWGTRAAQNFPYPLKCSLCLCIEKSG